ncbi:MAG: SCO family protein [Pseudomonadota bacterium]
MKSRIAVVSIAVFGLLAGLVVSAWLSNQGPEDPNPLLKDATALFGQERPLPAFQLEDHNGERFDGRRLQGRWTLLFFGYTFCPDVCPLTMSNIGITLEKLPDNVPEGALQVGFVTVDPKRDTRERLAQYVPFFNPDFIGITGEKIQIDTLVRALGGVYQFGEPDEHGNYIVDHSSRLLLIDPQGRFNAILSDRAAPEVLAGDLETLFKAYAG